MEILFLALLVALMAWALGSGFPVAFALPGSAIITILLAAGSGYLFAGSPDAYFAQGGPSQWLSAGVTNLRGVYWEVERDTLIAIPLFIFMGIMLQRSKIAEDLLVTMAQLFGPVPGGLGISVVFVGALLAATTGIVGATVVAMGLISLPAMLRNNYSKSLATGTIAASGTLGQIIPPSIVLIILADQLASATDQASTARKALYKESTGELSMPSPFDVTSTSAGEMFLGALVPGLVLVGLYMAYILIYALIRPHVAPPVRSEGWFDREFFFKLGLALVPPLTLIFLVLGSIIAGIATVNQAGAIGAAGALLMASYRLTEGQKNSFTPAILALIGMAIIVFATSTFNTNIRDTAATGSTGVMIALAGVALLVFALGWSAWRTFKIDETLQGVMIETAKTTSLVFIILLGAAMLTAAFRAFGGEELVKGFLEGLPGGFWTKFIIVMLVIFVLGFFLDFIEIAVVVVPIVAPILLADPEANITAVWLGVMIGLNIQTSFLTPPFGFALFYLRGVAPAIVKTIDMYKGVIAFIGLQITALVIVGLYPPLVNYLPNRVALLSDTAPPPRNPRLQYCIEEYTVQQFSENRAAIDAALSTAKGLDFSVLPRDLSRDAPQSFADAEKSIELLAQAKQFEADVQAAAVEYRPFHSVVRRLESDMRHIDEVVEELETAISRERENEARKARLEKRVENLKAERAELLAQIPAEWPERQSTFQELTKKEAKARTEFRRAADGSYAKIQELQAVLAANEAFVPLESELQAMRSAVETGSPDETQEALNELAKKFGDVEGASDIRSELSKARRELRRSNPRMDRVMGSMDAALATYAEQKAWRASAAEKLGPGLAAYEEFARDTFGIRAQRRLTRDQALYMASCISDHRDISLNF
ncbi:TRAP transporter large permease subunit [Pseudahrensia aquimaris]|uniref:TRAP transporter large permease subunit n=1 Tax=Pseudahrensia aquimaris TaxID=744461 RepID=A0ABW3FDG1_9HYPH